MPLLTCSEPIDDGLRPMPQHRHVVIRPEKREMRRILALVPSWRLRLSVWKV